MADRSDAQPSGWRLDELTSAGRENLDAGHVSRYDDKEDAGATAEVELLRSHGLTSADTVVDLGAGTGQFTIAVAPMCARVVAVDVSPLMLDQLRTKVTQAGLTNVEIVEAGFVSYTHTGPPADLVYSRWALHHIGDFWKSIALHRMRTMMRPGGLLRLADLVYSFEPAEAEERLEAWCATLPTNADEGDWVRADIEEHIRDEHSTYSWLLEPMIERAGFRIETADYSTDSVTAHYLARAI